MTTGTSPPSGAGGDHAVRSDPDGRFHVACVGRTPFAIRDVTTGTATPSAAIVPPDGLTDEQANEYMMDDGSEDSYEPRFSWTVGSARARFRRFRSGLTAAASASGSLPKGSNVGRYRRRSPRSTRRRRPASVVPRVTTDRVLLRAASLRERPDARARSGGSRGGEAGECSASPRVHARSSASRRHSCIGRKGAATDDPTRRVASVATRPAAEDLPSGLLDGGGVPGGEQREGASGLLSSA